MKVVFDKYKNEIHADSVLNVGVLVISEGKKNKSIYIWDPDHDCILVGNTQAKNFKVTNYQDFRTIINNSINRPTNINWYPTVKDWIENTHKKTD
jgi:hypothetical protein